MENIVQAIQDTIEYLYGYKRGYDNPRIKLNFSDLSVFYISVTGIMQQAKGDEHINRILLEFIKENSKVIPRMKETIELDISYDYQASFRKVTYIEKEKYYKTLESYRRLYRIKHTASQFKNIDIGSFEDFLKENSVEFIGDLGIALDVEEDDLEIEIYKNAILQKGFTERDD